MNWPEALVSIASLITVAWAAVTVQRARLVIDRTEELRSVPQGGQYHSAVVGLACSYPIEHDPECTVTMSLTLSGAAMRPGSVALVDYPDGHSYVGDVDATGKNVTWKATHWGDARTVRIGGDWRWA